MSAVSRPSTSAAPPRPRPKLGYTRPRAVLRAAEINLGYTVIEAPIDGQIGRSAYSPGNLVGPDSGVLATTVSQDPMYVAFPVSTRVVLEFQRQAGRAGRRMPSSRRRRMPPPPLNDVAASM